MLPRTLFEFDVHSKAVCNLNVCPSSIIKARGIVCVSVCVRICACISYSHCCFYVRFFGKGVGCVWNKHTRLANWAVSHDYKFEAQCTLCHGNYVVQSVVGVSWEWERQMECESEVYVRVRSEECVWMRNVRVRSVSEWKLVRSKVASVSEWLVTERETSDSVKVHYGK